VFRVNVFSRIIFENLPSNPLTRDDSLRADALQPADTKGYRLATGALKKAEMKMTVCKDILVDKDNQWQPLVDKKCKAIDGQATLVVVAVFVLLLGVIIHSNLCLSSIYYN
jgi:hypothetical protein